MHHFVLDGHLDRHLRQARRVYGERHMIVTSFVDEMVEQGLLDPGPTTHAGLHLSARLPAGVVERDVIAQCRSRDVALTSLALSWMREPTVQSLLIGFGRSDPSALARGLPVVRDALRS